MALQTACPKPPPRWMAKAQKVADAKKQERECYAAVDRRDEHCCRVCGKRVGGLGLLTRVEHHHLVYRSKGGEHTTRNVLSLCVQCHHAQHQGEIRLSGNADSRNHAGVLDGVQMERPAETASGWETVRWV